MFNPNLNNTRSSETRNIVKACVSRLMWVVVRVLVKATEEQRARTSDPKIQLSKPLTYMALDRFLAHWIFFSALTGILLSNGAANVGSTIQFGCIHARRPWYSDHHVMLPSQSQIPKPPLRLSGA